MFANLCLHLYHFSPTLSWIIIGCYLLSLHAGVESDYKSMEIRPNQQLVIKVEEMAKYVCLYPPEQDDIRGFGAVILLSISYQKIFSLKCTL